MKINHTEFLKKFEMNSGGYYWGGDTTVQWVNRLWNEYKEISDNNSEEYLKMVDIFAKNLGTPQQINR